MRFKFWLAVARTCRRLMVWAASRAMAADPNVLVFARMSEAVAFLRREQAEEQQRERSVN